jgi:hypothetical protein
LHPAQLPVRYAVTYAFFLQQWGKAGERLRNFLHRAAQASRVGTVFDDAATGQGLLNFFLRAEAAGAVTAEEVAAHLGVSPDKLATRTFSHLVTP